MSIPLDLKQAPLVVKHSKRTAEEYSIFLSNFDIPKKDFPVIINGKYFQIAELNEKKIKATRMPCPDNKAPVLSATIDSTREQPSFNDASYPYIEPTPVLVRGATSSSYRIGLLSKSDQDYYQEGSGKGKRQYNLEDFLVWMPSGDGPTERWNHYTSNYEWKERETTTVYVTSTKYETVIMSPYIVIAPTEVHPFAYTSTVSHLGKAFSNNGKTELVHECKIYRVLKRIPPEISDNTFDKNVPHSNPNNKTLKGENEILQPPIKHPDPFNFVESSMGYSRPSLSLPTPYTDFISPTIHKEEPKYTSGIAIYISSYYDMKTINVESTNINYFSPTVVSSLPTKTNIFQSMFTEFDSTTPLSYESSSSIESTSELPPISLSTTNFPFINISETTNFEDSSSNNQTLLLTQTTPIPTLEEDITVSDGLSTSERYDAIDLNVTQHPSPSKPSLSSHSIDVGTTKLSTSSILELFTITTETDLLSEANTTTSKVTPLSETETTITVLPEETKPFSILSFGTSDNEDSLSLTTASSSDKESVYYTTDTFPTKLRYENDTTIIYKTTTLTTLSELNDSIVMPTTSKQFNGIDIGGIGDGISIYLSSFNVSTTMEDLSDDIYEYETTSVSTNGTKEVSPVDRFISKYPHSTIPTVTSSTFATVPIATPLTSDKEMLTTPLPLLTSESIPDPVVSASFDTISTKAEILPTISSNKSDTVEFEFSTPSTSHSEKVPCLCDSHNDSKQTTKIESSPEHSTAFSKEGIAFFPTKMPSTVLPSQSTAALEKKYWVRSTLVGTPENQNKSVFQYEMQNKLKRAYTLAFKRHLLPKNSTKKEASETEENSLAKRARRNSLVGLNNRANMTKPVSRRSKRRSQPNIDVRMQDVNFDNARNKTELIYSVIEEDNPVLASRAVSIMGNLNQTEMEEFIGYPLAVKAEEYLRESKITAKHDLNKMFALIIGITSFAIVLVALFVSFWAYKRCKSLPSFDSSGELREGSEISYPQSPGPAGKGPGQENLGFIDTHDEESTPEDGRSCRLSPETTDHAHIIMPKPPSSRPSSSSPRYMDEEEAAEHATRNEETYAVVASEKGTIDYRRSSLEEPLYSTPKPLSQRQANIQVALQHSRFPLPVHFQEQGSSDFIPGTSLPKFLPPPRPQFPLIASPQSKPTETPSRSYSLDESQWLKEDEENAKILPSQVQETTNLEGSMHATSRASSDVEISTETSKAGVGLRHLRKRFHELLDDAFSMMNGQKPSDKVTPLGTPYHFRRMHSALPTTRSTTWENLEDGNKTFAGARRFMRASRRPWSAAPAYHASSESTSHTIDSLESSPRAAWTDQGGSITPVNLPHIHPESRPDSAPLGRNNRVRRSPTPIDPETGLKMGDPAVPLIKAIKEELHRFKSSLNNDATDA